MAAGSQVVSNPRIGSEVTQDWLDHMLTTYERRRDPGAAVKVINFEVKPGKERGGEGEKYTVVENFGHRII